jgi:hypothetical protein
MASKRKSDKQSGIVAKPVETLATIPVVSVPAVSSHTFSLGGKRGTDTRANVPVEKSLTGNTFTDTAKELSNSFLLGLLGGNVLTDSTGATVTPAPLSADTISKLPESMGGNAKPEIGAGKTNWLLYGSIGGLLILACWYYFKNKKAE